MSHAPPTVLPYLPPPAVGRVYASACQVRLGDCDPSGRARLDALARYLQDVGEDDANDAGWPTEIAWLLRRCVITIRRFPALGERLELETFCSAAAPKWAERTTTMTGSSGGSVQASAIWVAVDTATGRPTRSGELFDRIYLPSSEGRRASSKLSLPRPDAAALAAARPWPLRTSDLDVFDHVNNAVHWQAVEGELGRCDWVPRRAEIEHNRAVVLGDPTVVVRAESEAALDVWLVAGDAVLTSARLHR